MGEKIRLLIVEDSMVMRKMIQQLVESDPAIEVVGAATNGREGVEMALALRPDVITMDVRMPIMDGLQALKAIMDECPTRVLMLSAMTTEGADETLEALESGAVDFLPKGDGGKPGNLSKFRQLLVGKIRAVMKSHLTHFLSATPTPVQPKKSLPRPAVSHRGRIEVVLIGTSTGGPNALQTVIPKLPADLPVGVLVVQHMPATFTQQLARRLDQSSALQVKEAEEGDKIQPGRLLLAPGHSHLVLRQRGQVGLEKEPSNLLHRPAVDVMLDSAAGIYGAHVLGVILTGMGQDGKVGAAELKKRGGRLIAQDEATSVVYGMPRAVADLADQVCHLEQISAAILASLS